MRLSTTSAIASAATSLTIYGNSIISCGPQVGWGGGFANSNPNGIKTLLSSYVAAGSAAPYSRFFVRGSAIRVRPVNFAFIDAGHSEAVNTIPYYVYVQPTPLGDDLSAVTLSNLRELPLVKTLLIQATAQDSSIAPTLTHQMTTQRVFGIKYLSTMEDNSYCGDSVTYPVLKWWWNIIIRAIDGVNTVNATIQADVDYDVELYNRNPLNSANTT